MGRDSCVMETHFPVEGPSHLKPACHSSELGFYGKYHPLVWGNGFNIVLCLLMSFEKTAAIALKMYPVACHGSFFLRLSQQWSCHGPADGAWPF